MPLEYGTARNEGRTVHREAFSGQSNPTYQVSFEISVRSLQEEGERIAAYIQHKLDQAMRNLMNGQEENEWRSVMYEIVRPTELDIAMSVNGLVTYRILFWTYNARAATPEPRVIPVPVMPRMENVSTSDLWAAGVADRVADDIILMRGVFSAASPRMFWRAAWFRLRVRFWDAVFAFNDFMDSRYDKTMDDIRMWREPGQRWKFVGLSESMLRASGALWNMATIHNDIGSRVQEFSMAHMPGDSDAMRPGDTGVGRHYPMHMIGDTGDDGDTGVQGSF